MWIEPLVRLIPVRDEQHPRRLGLLAGTARIDGDRKRDVEDGIEAMFDLGWVGYAPQRLGSYLAAELEDRRQRIGGT